jgi:hypothetical protein
LLKDLDSIVLMAKTKILKKAIIKKDLDLPIKKNSDLKLLFSNRAKRKSNLEESKTLEILSKMNLCEVINF